MDVKNTLDSFITKKNGVVPYKSKTKKLIYISVFIVILIIGIGGYFLYTQNSELQQYKADKDVSFLKSQIEKHIILPKGEPLIATINDIEKLKKDQTFYQNAENGDKVFIWQDKALIYRPSLDRIVDFGIIISPNVTPTSTPTPSKSK